MTTDHADIAEAILAWYADPAGGDQMRPLLADDVVTTDWMTPDTTVVGADRFMDEIVAPAHEAFPDAKEEVVSTVFDGDTLMVTARFSATSAAEFYPGYDGHGGPLSWMIVDRWVMRDGHVAEIHFAADTAQAFRQLGEAPDAAS